MNIYTLYIVFNMNICSFMDHGAIPIWLLSKQLIILYLFIYYVHVHACVTYIHDTCYAHIHDIVCTLIKALLFQGVRSINGRIYVAHKEMYSRATITTTNRTV